MNTVGLKTCALIGRFVIVFVSVLCCCFFVCFVLFFFLRRIKLKAPFTIWIGRKIVVTGKSSLADLIGYNAFEYKSLEHVFK